MTAQPTPRPRHRGEQPGTRQPRPAYGNWTGSNVANARAYIGARLPLPCGKCGKPVQTHQLWNVGHIVPRWQRPDLALQPSNWQAEHRGCSTGSATGEVIARAREQGRREGRAQQAAVQYEAWRNDNDDDEATTNDAQRDAFFGGPADARLAPTDVVSLHVKTLDGEVSEHDATDFAAVCASMDWLAGFADVPADAAPPRYMTARHPQAVGTYGPQFLAWLDEHDGINSRRSTGLRWWQRLAATRLLEHDADGVLVWRTALVTLARQLGKSWLLRALVLWRIDVGADLWGEDQTVIHMAHKLAAAQEVWRPAARWSKSQGWRVRFANGEECVESPSGGRWLIRAAMDGVGVGFSLSLLVVDEAWKIPRTVVEAADPALDESTSPQLLVVSTAGDSASDLFGTYRDGALTDLAEPGTVLLLEWSAPRAGCDPEDEEGWRAASPHWTDKRRATIRDKLGRLEALEFAQNYLNQWVDVARGRQVSDVVVEPDVWAQLADDADQPGPGLVQVAALEASYSDGVSLAVVVDGVVGVESYPTLADAVAAALEVRAPVVLAGKSIANDPLLSRAGVQPVGATTRQVVASLRRLIDDGNMRHDGSPELSRQVLALRTQPGLDGPRVLPRGRVDAVKAAVWACDRAREVVERPTVF